MARELAARLNSVASSFGEYVRYLAAAAGEDTERQSLQHFGQRLVEADTEAFVDSFLKWAFPSTGDALVIDGVRHVAVDKALRMRSAASGHDYFLILLETSFADRAKRRPETVEAELLKLEDHPVEREAVTALPQVADIIVDGSGDQADVLSRIALAAPKRLASFLA